MQTPVFEVNFRTFLPECSLPFLPRRLDEIVFEVLGEPRESAGHGSLMPSGNTDIHAPEKWKCSPAAFESVA
jgi:hypothetical protein